MAFVGKWDRRAQKDSELQLFVCIAFLCNSLQKGKYIEAEEKQYDMSCCADMSGFSTLLATRLTLGNCDGGEHDPCWQLNLEHLRAWSPENKQHLPCSSNPIRMLNCITCKLNRLDV